MKKRFLLFGLCFSAVLNAAAVTAAPDAAAPASTLFQVSTVFALEEGVFDGDYSYRDLMKKGDLGLGTFNGIDGELVAVDGKFYQTTPECRLIPVSPDLKSPFAEIIPFQPTIFGTVSNSSDYHDLGQKLLAMFPNPNTPYAIRLDGEFSSVKFRSLTKVTPPFPNLLEANKKQAVKEMKNVKGTAVGFWFPQYWEGVGMPIFHLHFATEDRQFGGHVLAISVANAKVQLQSVQNIQIYLPNTKEFSQAHIEDTHSIQKNLNKTELSSH